MITHLFKIIWKRRKSNFLIILEIFVAFLILFAVGSLGTYFYRGYIKPTGINADNVWVLFIDYNTDSDSSRAQNSELLHQKLKNFNEIKIFSFTQTNVPYGFSTSNGSVSVKDKTAMTHFLEVDENYPSVLGLEMVEGTWFKNSDTFRKSQPVVITQSLKEALFGNEPAVGKRLGVNEDSQVVIGVTGAFKNQNEFQTKDHASFSAIRPGASTVVLKVDPSVSAEFEAQFAKSIQQIGKNWTIEILHMDDMKVQANSIVVIPMTIVCIVSGFLIINVMLGLFGVLFQNIQRRRGEIGIRRAMGATQNDIMRQFIGETIVLTTLGVLFGIFFAIQFPIMNVFDVETSLYVVSILLSVLTIYLLVTICAYYPSKQAAQIYPATALHED